MPMHKAHFGILIFKKVLRSLKVSKINSTENLLLRGNLKNCEFKKGE